MIVIIYLILNIFINNFFFEWYERHIEYQSLFGHPLKKNLLLHIKEIIIIKLYAIIIRNYMQLYTIVHN